MISQFFIHRPKFAFVIAIVITLSGLLAIPTLPVAQFPELAPAQIVVSTNYPGASADIVDKTVASPLESEVNGVEGMIYMSSNSSNDGSYALSVTFEVGFDADLAQILVQNRVSKVMPRMPEEVKRAGIAVEKQSPNMLLIVNLYSSNDQFDNLFLANYMLLNVRDSIARISGVSKSDILGAMDYSMRMWLNPDRMAALGITVNDVRDAIAEQNIQVAAGKIGSAPSMKNQQFQYTLLTKGRLESVSEFEQIVIRAKEDGSLVYMKDVARVELGSKSYDAFATLNNKPSATLAIYQQPGANALDISDAIRKKMEDLKQYFPDGLKYDIIYDTTRFIEVSLLEVVETLFIALLLVVLVVYVFLGDFRSTFIPGIAIPVSLIGTFAVLLALGMSINTISLFALILAIGIVVDDAIIVIESTQRLMAEGMDRVTATQETMKKVTGPIVATTLVLLAVFVPVALMPGITGKIYSEFAITISIAVIISSINALTLSPALCASILKPGKSKRLLFLEKFEKYLHKLTGSYVEWVKFLCRRTIIVAVFYLGLIAITGLLVTYLPGGFIPEEDQGYMMVDVQLPDGASLNRTERVVEKLTKMMKEESGVSNVLGITGYSLLTKAVASNVALLIVVLDDWEQRTESTLSQSAILHKLQGKVTSIKEANVFMFSTPAIPGLGSTGGFEFIMQDTAGRSQAELASVARALIIEANGAPEIGAAFTSFRANVPQLFVDLERVKAKNLGISVQDIFLALQVNLGGYYVNDFNRYGKVYNVYIQAEKSFRNSQNDIKRLYVRQRDGKMVPLSTLTTIKPILGPQVTSRYNIQSSVTINGSAAPGYSSGQAIIAMEKAAQRVLPDGYQYQWTGLTYQQLAAGNLAPILFSLAIIFVFLFLVAQYESWSIPLAVLLAVPIALLGAFLAVLIAQSDVNIYTQIGLVILIGLSAKNAILVVEYAKELHETEGLPVFEAAVKAAHLRFRAVLMTALSFVLGVIPLVIATGAGAGSRNSIGLAVFGGMVMATIVGTLLVPVFFVIIQNLRNKIKGKQI
ncbi:MAG: efflux RND transporter permease subunit [Gammaproteobacteria bacterium]